MPFDLNDFNSFKQSLTSAIAPEAEAAEKPQATIANDEDVRLLRGVLGGESANDPQGWVAKLNTYYRARKPGETLAQAAARVSSAAKGKSDQFKIYYNQDYGNQIEQNVGRQIEDTIRSFAPDPNWDYVHHEAPSFYKDTPTMINRLKKKWGTDVDYDNPLKQGKEWYFRKLPKTSMLDAVGNLIEPQAEAQEIPGQQPAGDQIQFNPDEFQQIKSNTPSFDQDEFYSAKQSDISGRMTEFDQALQNETDQAARQKIINEQAKLKAEQEAMNPENWPLSQVKSYFKRNPPADPQAAAQVEALIQKKTQEENALKAGVENTIMAGVLTASIKKLLLSPTPGAGDPEKNKYHGYQEIPTLGPDELDTLKKQIAAYTASVPKILFGRTGMYEDPDIKAVIEAHPIASFAGELTTDLALLKGIGKLTAPLASLPILQKVSRGIAALPIISNIAKGTKAGMTLFNPYEIQRYVSGAVHAGSTFGMLSAMKHAGIPEPDENILKSTLEAGADALWGSGLGLAQSAPNYLSRVIAASTYGGVTTKLSGGSNEDVALNTVLFGAFELMGGKDVDKKIKLMAMDNQNKAMYEYVLKTGMPPEQAAEFVSQGMSQAIQNAGGIEKVFEGSSAPYMNMVASVLDRANPKWRFTAPKLIEFKDTPSTMAQIDEQIGQIKKEALGKGKVSTEASETAKSPVEPSVSTTETVTQPVPDQARIQELTNSIQEGEMILKSGKNVRGEIMSPEEQAAVVRSIESTKNKLSELTGVPRMTGAQGVTETDLLSAIDTFAKKGMGVTSFGNIEKTRGFDRNARKDRGLKLWEDMPPAERHAEFKSYAIKDFTEAQKEIQGKPIDYMLDRALDPLDPMSGVYKIMLKRMGATIEGNKIKLSDELKKQHETETAGSVIPETPGVPKPITESRSKLDEAADLEFGKKYYDLTPVERSKVLKKADLLGTPSTISPEEAKRRVEEKRAKRKAEAQKSKEPWQMTKKEFIESKNIQVDKNGEGGYSIKEGPSNYYDKLQNSQGNVGGLTFGTKRTVSNSPLKLKFKKQGYFSFPQEKIGSPADIAFAFRQLKNEAVERLYVIAVKEGKPIAVEPLHAGTVNASLANVFETTPILLEKSADGFFLVHNHPSGNVKPSVQDHELSIAHRDALEKHGIKFLGHVIIDDTKFGLITPETESFIFDAPHATSGKHKVPYYTKYVEWYQDKMGLTKISSAGDVYELVKGISTDWENNSVVFYLNNGNKVLAVDVLPREKVDVVNISKPAVSLRASQVIVANAGSTSSKVSSLRKELNQFNITLSDNIEFDQKDKVFGSFQSFADEGLLGESKEDYNSLEVTHRKAVKKALEEGLSVPPEVLKDYPELLGQAAFKRGLKRVPFTDKLFMSTIAGEVGSNAGKYEAWYKGWDKENLRPEIEGSGSLGLSPGKGEPMNANQWQKEMPKEPETKEKINKTQILQWVQKNFKVPIRGKATHRWRASGMYYTKQALIRLGTWGELEVMTHELAHDIDYQLRKVLGSYWRINSVPKEQRNAAIKELAGLDYDQGKRRSTEGFAEYMRHWLTNTGDAPKLAPVFDKFFRGVFLKEKPELGKKLETLRNMLDVWYKQGAEERIMQHIDFKGEHTVVGGVENKIKKINDWVNKNWVDEFYTIKKVEEGLGLKVGKNITPTQSPYELAVYAKSKAGCIARTYVEKAAVDEYGNVVGPSLIEVLKPIGRKEWRPFFAYAVAKRAILLAERGIESGFDVRDVRFIAEKYKNPEWDTVIDNIQKWNEHALDWIVRAGGLTPEEKAHIVDLNPIYIPFKRAFLDEMQVSRSIGGYVDRGSSIKAIHGSGRPIINPFEAMTAQMTEMFLKANKLRIARAVADLAKIPGAGNFIMPVAAPIKAVKFTVADIADQLNKLGFEFPKPPEGTPIEEQTGLAEMLLSIYGKTDYHGKDNIVAIIEKGERKYYELHPDLYRALKGLDAIQQGPVLKVLSPFPRLLRLGATGLNVSFALGTNPIRDTLFAAAASKRGLTFPILNSLTGAYRELTAKPGDLAARFKFTGGELSGMIGLDRAAAQSVYDEIMASKFGKFGKVLMVVKHPLDAMRNLLSFWELAPRTDELYGMYEIYKKDYPDWTEEDRYIKAFNDAQDLTVNFTRSGYMGKRVNEATAFFNVAVQGPNKIYRAMRDNPMLFLLKSLAFLTLPALMLYFKNKGKQWYENMPLEYKYNSLFIEAEEGTVVRLPIPYDVGALFIAGPQAALDYMEKHDPKAFEALASIMAAQFPQVVPSMLEPLIDAARNKNYLNKPIETAGMQFLPVTERKRPGTLPIAVGMSKILDKASFGKAEVSPVVMEYLLNSYTGGGLRQLPMQKVVEPADLPMIGRFFVRGPDEPRRQTEDFFTDWTMLNQKKQIGLETPQERIRLIQLRHLYERFTKKPAGFFSRIKDAELKGDLGTVRELQKEMQETLKNYGYE